MARLILDTTFLIDAERQGEQLDLLIADDDDVAISAVTVAELLVGVELADRRRRAARDRYVAGVLATVPVEAYDTGVARAHAALLAWVRRAGRPRGVHDLIIAATAVERNRIVVSADASAFSGLPGLAVRPAKP